jgi:two-component system osmolarity sensor histidine kinase EnvZ
MLQQLKSFLPRSLVVRAALILIMPVLLVQLLVSAAFIDRHYTGVTQQMTEGLGVELNLLLVEVNAKKDPQEAKAALARLAKALDLTAELPSPTAPPDGNPLGFWDWSGRDVAAVLQQRLGTGFIAVDLVSGNWTVYVHLASNHGSIRIGVDRKRLSALNPHQLLVIMVLASLLSTLIASVFLRNQLVPITRLARAADAFGKGRVVPYRVRGATEVRAAGKAFLDMRDRIERQIEQRTLLLSGVSHDLRTPITRLRLGLSMQPETEDTAALIQDVSQMERLVEEFLTFARGDATEDSALCDPTVLMRDWAADAGREGQEVELILPQGRVPNLRLRPDALGRAVGNLLANAGRFGKVRRLSLDAREPGHLAFVVEDDGPGIAPADRETALQPFQRLDAARDPNHGGGVGLGLAIAADIARSHGGTIVLDQSPDLGGLRARLSLPL